MHMGALTTVRPTPAIKAAYLRLRGRGAPVRPLAVLRDKTPWQRARRTRPSIIPHPPGAPALAGGG
ncbi:hypothetical protein GCM10009416_43450 [Craurococcus roseus]|uniref:Uncharacterized protein n=2 Tax=Craurococcus roseus TaxID=77585 RepID=A0ABN1FZ74_9PROT